MRTVLLIGGTRNLGPEIVHTMLRAGWRVAVLNRGATPDHLPEEVERLRADRRDRSQLAAALGGRGWDAVVDTALYDGDEARLAVELFRDRVGHYVFISSGQVYLVRRGLERPFRERDYAGETITDPGRSSPDYDDWKYGVDKRAAEDGLFGAGREGFPFTTLRLPMIHGERDHYQRILNYLRRVEDGGPILVPDDEPLPIRHVDVRDVADGVARVIESGAGKGDAFNVGVGETATLAEFFELLGRAAGRPVSVARIPRARLESAALLPACSPFSGRWMSSLDNAKGVTELGLRYRPFRETVARVVGHYQAHPELVPAGYGQRAAELDLIEQPW